MIEKGDDKGQFKERTYWITERGIAEYLAKNMAMYNEKFIKHGRYPSADDKEALAELYKIRDLINQIKELLDVDRLNCRISNDGLFIIIEINGRNFQIKEDPAFESLTEKYAKEIKVITRKCFA